MRLLTNFLLLLLSIFITSCEKQNSGFDSAEKSINSILKDFPMIDRKLEKSKELDLDSLSISIYRNPEKIDYDEILVFRKKNKFYAIPFFSNMYFDYWNFEGEKQKQLYEKTNTNFSIELKKIVTELNLTQEEFGLIFEELMENILNTETNLHLKPKIFQNYIYSINRVDKYKIEENDSCLRKTNEIYNKILKDFNRKEALRNNQFYLDSKNGRVYEFINDSRKKDDFKFNVKTYRIECFSYRLEI
ncbi:hypothetical protein [Chryseobacterium sp. Leaf394]|uniref:hypothetical protein n=1 Tax=Chryseobacterium sp. Leaf394 TaxID=1736361 RepID=UPI0006FC850F|nr:hypothetical protein [Chryseobacterium sp. Leaf394]KQS91519.1 hypothetical protein ASG21_03345 [Chryseobacterium sp. Leaf394]